MVNHIKTFILLFITLTYSNAYALDDNIKILTDLSYGKDKAQKLDVYLPTEAKDAPIIFMIHGGAWSGGDKANKSEVENKVAHWVNKGFIFISTNYRTLPKVDPIGQAKDIEAALFYAQQNAAKWGGSPDKFILIGHSSGAHLVSLVSANFSHLIDNGVTPWLGTISLDISGYDIVSKVAGANPSSFYQEKFGKDLDYLTKASPLHVLTNKIPSFLAICSTQNGDACSQANNFLTKAKSLGSHGELIASDFDHNALNSELGKATCYTKSVDAFIKKLDPSLSPLLKTSDSQMTLFCANS